MAGWNKWCFLPCYLLSAVPFPAVWFYFWHRQNIHEPELTQPTFSAQFSLQSFSDSAELFVMKHIFISSYHGSELVIDHSYHGNQHVLTRTFTINSSSSINLLKTCQRENTPDSSILVRICLNISLLIEQVQQMFRAYDRTCASWISVAGLL